MSGELEALREVVRDLDRYEELQDELERLKALEGAARTKAAARVTEIDKAMAALEEKHRAAGGQQGEKRDRSRVASHRPRWFRKVVRRN